MHSKLVITGGLVAAAFIAAACSPTSSAGGGYGAASAPASTAPIAAPSASPVSPATSGTAINIGATSLGQVLVDSSGQTVYLFLADKGTMSSCNSASCVQYWPPVVTTGTPTAGAGLNTSLLGTTTRTDGSIQVTYAGHPLYRFASDKKPGDVTGQGLSAFGAPWYVVSPSGAQVG